MKKFAIVLALMLLQTQLSVFAAKARKPYRAKSNVTKSQPKSQVKVDSVYNDPNYLLK